MLDAISEVNSTRELNSKLGILIVVPRIVARAGDWYQPPLGLGYVSAILKECGFSVFNLNLNESDDTIETQIQKGLTNNSIDVVMTGGVTGQYSSIFDVVYTVKKNSPEIINVVGGGIVTSAPLEAMEALEFADLGVIGEGELIIAKLSQMIATDGDLKAVPGIVYRDENGSLVEPNNRSRQRWIRSKGVLPYIDVKKLPFPDHDAIGFRSLSKVAPNILGMSDLQTLPIITSRGCPFQCTFCYQPDGHQYRMRDLDDVFAEIDLLVEKYGVKYLSITDELFGARKGRVEEFCARIKPYGIKWTATFRIPQLTEAVVKLLKESNFHTASLGIESMDDEILISMKKKINREQIENGLELLHRSGIGIQGVLIFGDPAETKETIENTLNWWSQHLQYDLQLSAVIAYPGTPVFEHAKKKGLIPDTVEFIKQGCPLVKLSDMPQEDYKWMFEQILSMPRTKYPKPDHLINTKSNFQRATLDWNGVCTNCGTKNNWTDVKTFMLESMACTDCGSRHVAPLTKEFSSRIIRNYKILTNLFGKVSFWGINSYFYWFIKEFGSYFPGCYLLDQSEARIGIEIFPVGSDGKFKIQSPDYILGHSKSRCVVVAVPNYFSNIESHIEKNFPNVEMVLSILDLIGSDYAENRRLGDTKQSNMRFVRPDLYGQVSGTKI